MHNGSTVKSACKQCKQHINCPVMVHMACPVVTVSQQVDGQNGARRLD